MAKMIIVNGSNGGVFRANPKHITHYYINGNEIKIYFVEGVWHDLLFENDKEALRTIGYIDSIMEDNP